MIVDKYLHYDVGNQTVLPASLVDASTLACRCISQQPANHVIEISHTCDLRRAAKDDKIE